jgi:hypothetical protein
MERYLYVLGGLAGLIGTIWLLRLGWKRDRPDHRHYPGDWIGDIAGGALPLGFWFATCSALVVIGIVGY